MFTMCLYGTPYCHVVAFRPATGEDYLIRLGPDQHRNLAAGVLDVFFYLPAERMHT
jgi:hypothetical protein